MREFLPVSMAAFVTPLRPPCLVACDRMRPRSTKAESCSSFLGDEFVGCFDNRAKWITQLASVLPVGMVNAPEVFAGLQSRNRFHGDSSPEIKCVKMYLIHKMRGQSV